MSDLISIIVPAYNIESYIGRTLDSLLAQSYPNIEIVVVNDGGADNTGAVIDEYAEKHPGKIKAIHTENGGVTNARLTGVANASGEWIGFADGDDVIEPDMYERLMANAVKYGADLSHCGYKMVFPSREDLYYGTGKLVEQDNDKGISDLLEGGVVEPGLWNKLYKKEIFDAACLEAKMDRTIKNTEDLLMNYYLFRESKKSVYEDFCPYHYILRGNSATSTVSEHQLVDPLKVTRILLKETSDMNEYQLILKRKLTRLLISLATRAVTEKTRDIVIPHRKAARKELRTMLPEILSGKFCGMKLKIMALWTGIWPASYCFVHTVYGRISGVDKKYEIK